jgi:hypothetical protein
MYQILVQNKKDFQELSIDGTIEVEKITNGALILSVLLETMEEKMHHLKSFMVTSNLSLTMISRHQPMNLKR